MTKIFILFDRDIDDIHFIVELLAKMKAITETKIVYVRTKCDTWQPGMKPIEEQLQIDLKEIRRYDPNCEKVLAVGFKMYDEIRK
jgi:hypothetical protein